MGVGGSGSCLALMRKVLREYSSFDIFLAPRQNINGAMDLKAIHSLCKYMESRCTADIIRNGMLCKNISVLSR